MDSFSDSSRYDLDSITSTDSLQLITDEFRLRHIGTPDVSNAELSKRAASLELDNERLRVDVENCRIELNSKIAANQGLKDKITELYIEAQAALQERLKLENALKDAKSRAAAAENTSKWYQAQLHDSQACRKSLQSEIETYQRMARQRQQTILELTEASKRSNAESFELSRKFRKERQDLMEQIEDFRANTRNTGVALAPRIEAPASLAPDLSTKLEATEEELRDTKAELKAMEQRLLGSEGAKTSLEMALTKHRELMNSVEENIRRSEFEKNKITDRMTEAQFELKKLRSEKDMLQATLLSSEQEQSQVQQAIVQLRSQLTKMIAQHKLIKSRNAELEGKMTSWQEIKMENKRLKSLSFEANSSLFKKLREAKRKVKSLEEQLGKEHRQRLFYQSKNETDAALRECLKRALERNKELKKQIKLTTMTKNLEESIDEGYGDGIPQSLTMDLPNPPPLNPVLLHSVSRVLSEGRDFLAPVQAGLHELQLRIEKFQQEHVRSSYDHSSPLSHDSGQISPASPKHNARSVA